MMLMNPNVGDYVKAGYVESGSIWTPGFFEKCRCRRVSRTAPPEVVADLRHDSELWKKYHDGAPLYLFPGDPGYEESYKRYPASPTKD